MSLAEKFSEVFCSRRFYAAVSGVALVLLTDAVGMTEEQATMILGMLATWIIGDSLDKTGSDSVLYDRPRRIHERQ